MNRRMPNGTYGGVRGRAGEPPPYSIFENGGLQIVFIQKLIVVNAILYGILKVNM